MPNLFKKPWTVSNVYVNMYLFREIHFDKDSYFSRVYINMASQLTYEIFISISFMR